MELEEESIRSEDLTTERLNDWGLCRDNCYNERQESLDICSIDWHRVIDQYCERVGTDFDCWAEPVNAITNVAFLVAALWAYFAARKYNHLDLLSGLLCANVALIGIGSFLFHTHATVLTQLADIAPIATMILLYFMALLIRAYELRLSRALAVAVAIMLVSGVVMFALKDSLDDVTNVGYIAALLLILGNAVVLMRRNHELAWWLWPAVSIFAVSIMLRMLDEPLCCCNPLGTHFLWHLLNAILFGVLMTGYILHCQPNRRCSTK